MKHKVIDNFLDEKYFDRLVALITGKQPELVDQNMVDRVGGQMSWHFDTEIRWGAPENKLSYMIKIYRLNIKNTKIFSYNFVYIIFRVNHIIF